MSNINLIKEIRENLIKLFYYNSRLVNIKICNKIITFTIKTAFVNKDNIDKLMNQFYSDKIYTIRYRKKLNAKRIFKL